jgi:hypothetical protein
VSLPALAGFEKSLVDSSGHGVRCQAGPFGTEIISPCATVYGSILCRLSFCHVIESRRNPLHTFAEIFLMCLIPSLAADERESARSEGCLAGATERLFESLPGLAIMQCVTLTIQIMPVPYTNRLILRHITVNILLNGKQ